MDNRIIQEFKITEIELQHRTKEHLLYETSCRMNGDLMLTVKNISPIIQTEENGNIILTREIFVFTKEELEKFINKIKENGRHNYEV